MKPRTTVISVSFNSAQIIKKMLQSVPDNIAIKIVDNCSIDNISETVSNFNNCELIENASNQGFGRACNLGASESKTEFLFFLNPDAMIDHETISELEKFADKNPQMGAANPLIKSIDNKSKLKMSSIIPCKDLQRPKISEFGEMPILTGGALFVRRKVFEDIGGFDPHIFLYHEDHELCSRISKLGYSLWHVPKATAVHIGGSSSGRSAKVSHWKGYQMARSRYYVLDKFYPKEAFKKTFWPAFFGLINPVNLFSIRRFSKYIGQIKGAFSAKVDGGAFEITQNKNL